MNKRYIDFVPAKNDIPKGGLAKPKSIKVTTKDTEKPVKKTVEKSTTKPAKKLTRRIAPANPLLEEEIEVEEIFVEREEPKKPAKNTITPKFVDTEVKKRPLGAKKAAKTAIGVKVGSTAVKVKTATKAASMTKSAAKPVRRPAPLGQRTKFINTNKIEKRPLSNVMARKKPIIVPKAIEKPKAPEKIITKPEKDSKAGLIIAIILTIILGAAAGTVAFLLLPK